MIDAKGKVGKYLARVIGNPNRLVMDFDDTRVGNIPRNVSVGKSDIHEIRVGEFKSRARVVVDFRDRPVPAFKVRRENNRISLMLGNSLADYLPKAETERTAKGSDGGGKKSALTPTFVPAAANGLEGAAAGGTAPGKAAGSERASKLVGKRISSPHSSRRAHTGAHGVDEGARQTERSKLDVKEVKLAQQMDIGRPSSSQAMQSAPRSSKAGASPSTSVNVPSTARGGEDRRMVREVRPPVTPPTPDPRLLVQEITELRFFQVGHNSRLMIRGGDQLDYRMNNVSPTKIRLDLINAEIPKAHQKPLRTDLFSTSVEMIVPGSQTIFIQLKDSVPTQVQKQKGVLMIDFPPPRFKTEQSGDREGGGEATRIIQEEQIRKSIESRNTAIERVQKDLEQLQKQRLEILKSFQVTPDPEVFQKPVTMDFQGITLRNAFRLLAEQAGVNIIVGNEVSGTTTLRLFEVPLGQVMDTILNTHGLDRVMVGNVMRVGAKGAITTFKEERQKEYLQRMNEVDKRIESSRQEITSNQQEIERLLEELKTLQEAPVDDTKAEEIGEAGCIEYEGERICFQYATVRVVYARPSQIVTTLDCLFRLNCPGARAVGRRATTVTSEEMGDLQAEQAEGQMGRQQYMQYLSDQGFTSDSPGGRARMQRYDRVQSERERAAASAAMAAGVTQQGGGGVQVMLPYGEDPKLARILAYGIIWANDNDRMIFIKDTPERIAQMKKLIFTLDVPIPQVLIESRLVLAGKTFGRGLGVVWGGRNNQAGPLSVDRQLFWGYAGNTGNAARTATAGTTAGTPIPSQLAINLPPTISGFSTAQSVPSAAMQFGFLAGDYLTELDARLTLGESTGQTKTISRPKVQVADGQSAIISNGQRVPYQTITVEGTQTQLVNAVLSLTVMPRIYADGRIRMQINITDDSPDFTFSPPVINTRRSSTTLTVKDGETAVIGGILRNDGGDSRQGVPILMNVPVLGYLFSAKQASKSLAELLVFITPSIVRRPPPAS
ncbi:MAG: AMIN domain-containing protein [Desulfomonilaceae bacterium]|nr:AMIN domain-containing protein [Desulfomonilaceae bacterium]